MEADLFDVITAAVRSVSERTRLMTITPDSRLVEDLTLDSLDLVSVLMKLEDHYDLKIELDELPNIGNVAELGAHFQSLRGDRPAAA